MGRASVKLACLVVLFFVASAGLAQGDGDGTPCVKDWECDKIYARCVCCVHPFPPDPPFPPHP